MANQIKNETTLRTNFISENGKSYELNIERPKDNLTDSEYYDAMCKVMTSDAIKPDGTSLKTIKSMKLVNKEETNFDLEALNAD